jgi:hypothetical protein
MKVGRDLTISSEDPSARRQGEIPIARQPDLLRPAQGEAPDVTRLPVSSECSIFAIMQ